MGKMNCRKCGKVMKVICSSSRSGRGGYSSGTIFRCECGESCLKEGFDIDWGDRYKPELEEFKKIIEAGAKKRSPFVNKKLGKE